MIYYIIFLIVASFISFLYLRNELIPRNERNNEFWNYVFTVVIWISVIVQVLGIFILL